MLIQHGPSRTSAFWQLVNSSLARIEIRVRTSPWKTARRTGSIDGAGGRVRRGGRRAREVTITPRAMRPGTIRAEEGGRYFAASTPKSQAVYPPMPGRLFTKKNAYSPG
jgi:hypothetical protein